MINKLELFNEAQSKKDLPDIRPGDTVLISQKIKEGDKHKAQTFEGLVLARKHGKGISGTITVRKTVLGIGVEKIFPLHSPNIEKIEILRRGKTRRAKLYYLRTAKGRNAKLKRKEYKEEFPADDSKGGNPRSDELSEREVK
ncbi:MAG: 50S ribosomal protein L19 [Parcubacteria group bacterium]